MEFSLSSEQKLIFETAYEFGQSSIAPFALEWENSLIPKGVLKEAGELGFGSLYVSEVDGGSGLSRLDSTYGIKGQSGGWNSYNNDTNKKAKYKASYKSFNKL